ncbi:MAG: helix-turn-helix transcriptional regulator [Crocosphaera sp.]|nr:helix-turn-helix transcriptional regulator [Crocosphaera sp.]
MNQSATYSTNQAKLRELMQQAGIVSFEELSQVSGVSQWQLNRLLAGLLPNLSIAMLLQISKALQVPLQQLLTEFETAQSLKEDWTIVSADISEITATESTEFQQEYQQLQQQLNNQKESLEKDFQSSTIATLESWLLQWPTAAIVAQKNPEISAVKLLPLVKPVFELLKKWGLEMKGTVGEVVPYDPQFHQLLEGGGAATSGDPVIIRYVGYTQGEKLLYRAKVTPVKED